MSDINLLQSSGLPSTSIVSRGSQFLSRLLMIVLILSVAAYGYLQFDRWHTNRTIATTQAAINQAQSEAIQNKDRNEVITRQGQLKSLDGLLKEHMYWSYLLPELARVSLHSAKYTSITATGDGTLSLDVLLPSYDDLDKFLQIFDLPEYNKEFSDVRIKSISQIQIDGQLQTQVGLSLTFDPTYLKGHNGN